MDCDALILEHIDWARCLALLTLRQRNILIPADEAISAGNVALVEAAGRYRPGGRATFMTFAHRRIVGAVLDLSYSLCGSDRLGSRMVRNYYPAPIALEDMANELADDRSGPFEYAIACENSRRVSALLQLAKPSERAVLKSVYLDGLWLSEAGRRLGVTESRACQLAKSGLERIRFLASLQC